MCRRDFSTAICWRLLISLTFICQRIEPTPPFFYEVVRFPGSESGHHHSRRFVELADLLVQGHLFQQGFGLLLRLWAENVGLSTGQFATEQKQSNAKQGKCGEPLHMHSSIPQMFFRCCRATL